MDKDNEHIIIRKNALMCWNCGEKYYLILPLEIDVFTNKIEGFNLLHQDCPKTWNPPEITPKNSIEERLKWWIEYGETGKSSEVIVKCFTGQTVIEPFHPQDPDDFKRCHLLFELIPEWRSMMDKLKILSPVWEKLVDNWGVLTEHLLDMMENKIDNGMFDLMKKIGC